MGTDTRSTSAWSSLHMVHDSRLHDTGLRLPKSTNFNKEEGSLAESSCIEYLFAEMLFKRLYSHLFDENCPLSSFSLA